MGTPKEVFVGPWVLPQVQYGATRYFADLRLREFRQVDNPHNCIDFANEQGQAMCRQAGIVVCKVCGMVAIVSPSSCDDGLRCMRCLHSVMP